MATIPTPSSQTPSRIGPRSAGVRMAPEEFDAIPGSRFSRGYRYEVIRGVLVVSPFPGPEERGPNEYLGHLLATYQEESPEGVAIDDTLPEQTVVATNRRRADRAIWAGLGRRPDVATDVPAIVVEFVSRRRDALRDYEDKRDEYLAAGVREYWIIDRFRRLMTVYRMGIAGPTYDVVNESQMYRSEILPGFELPLAKLLEKADHWATARKPSRTTRRPAGPSGGTETHG